MKKLLKILIFFLIPFTVSGQIDNYPWYWQNHLAPVFLADSADMLGKVKFGTNGVYLDSVKYANDTLYFYTDSTATPFKMILNPGSETSLDSTWAIATVTEGLILPTGDTLKGMYPLNDSTMVIVNSDTTCMSGCSGSGGVGGNPILAAVTESDTTRWGTYNSILQGVDGNDTTRWAIYNSILQGVDGADTTRWGLSSAFDTMGIVLDVDLTGGTVTQVNTSQSAAQPKVVSIVDTVYNEYEDAFDIQYRFDGTWWIDIYSATSYDSLTIYYLRDDAGLSSGSGSGNGNIISAVEQNLSTQVDNGILFIQNDSLATSLNFTYNDTNIVYHAKGFNFDPKNIILSDIEVNNISSLNVFANTGFGSNNFNALTSGNSNTTFGGSAGQSITTGSNNTIISVAGTQLTTGSNNVFLGYNAGKNFTTQTGRLIIDGFDRSNLLGDSTNSIIFGFMGAVSSNQQMYLNSNVNIKHDLVVTGNTTLGNETTDITIAEGLLNADDTLRIANSFKGDGDYIQATDNDGAWIGDVNSGASTVSIGPSKDNKTTGLGFYGGNNLTFVSGGTLVAEVENGVGLTASQFNVDALNTAPSSASDTGVTGEIRITSDYIYVCISTNTWVRAALTTW